MFCYFNLRSILLLCALMHGVGSVWGDEFVKYSGAIVEGDYIITYPISTGYNAMNTTVSSNRLGKTLVTAKNDVVNTTDETIVWHIAPNGSYWTIFNSSVAKYAGGNNKKNQAALLSSVTNYAKWTITGSSTYEFENKGRAEGSSDTSNKWLRNNGGNGYACYSTSTGGALTLYKRRVEPVTITSAKYATYCSTNALNFSGTGITAYKAKVENGTVKMTEIEDGIVPANTGVILYKDVTEETMVQVPVTATNVTIADNELVGTTEKTLVNAMTDTKHNYIMQKSGTNIVFKKAVDGAYMPANRAYLSTDNESAARMYATFGETTEITTTDISNYTDPKDTWYVLDGRHIANGQRPTIKGIYIVNGRKVVIK